MKTLRAMILTLLLSLLLAAPALAAPGTLEVRDGAGRFTPQSVRTVSLVLDGRTLETDIPAFILGGRTLVPVRVISEDLGASVTWKQESMQVQIENGRTSITLTIGSAEAVVNGQTVRLYDGVPATMARKDGLTRTMVPVRFVTEQLGAAVDFDNENSAVRITAPQAPAFDVTAPRLLDDGTVTVSADAGAELSVFTLPGRVVADFPGGVLTDSSFGKLEVEGTAVTAVRYNQYDQGYDNARVARVVFDLREGYGIDDLDLDFTGGVLTLTQPAAPALPEPPEETPPEEEPDLPPLVVLDAGHGGTDIGAPYFGLYEKDLTLPITLAAGALLEEAGYRVEYTRSEDATVSLAARAEQANTQQADIFVSVHANAFVQKPEVHGLETYYLIDGDRAKVLAESIHRAVLDATGAGDREVRTANFYVLRNTAMPAVLVETGYMTNEAECRKLASPAYQQLLAQGIATGIMNYLGPPTPEA